MVSGLFDTMGVVRYVSLYPKTSEVPLGTSLVFAAVAAAAAACSASSAPVEPGAMAMSGCATRTPESCSSFHFSFPSDTLLNAFANISLYARTDPPSLCGFLLRAMCRCVGA